MICLYYLRGNLDKSMHTSHILVMKRLNHIRLVLKEKWNVY